MSVLIEFRVRTSRLGDRLRFGCPASGEHGDYHKRQGRRALWASHGRSHPKGVVLPYSAQRMIRPSQSIRSALLCIGLALLPSDVFAPLIFRLAKEAKQTVAVRRSHLQSPIPSVAGLPFKLPVEGLIRGSLYVLRGV